MIDISFENFFNIMSNSHDLVCGHVVLLDLFETHGVDLMPRDLHQATPLHYAAQMCAIALPRREGRVGQNGKIIENGIIKIN